ncbi:hypothetical protein AVEN_78824-1 [Araneus ventricosus]|uniref:Uncharacterized protein n=1 Tax=Araneus ventricosus TaxID=182803 RepID=A0A4Y2PQC0_ARAVE|nr:hypothetical protein AVEN_78824-1 [Araneus ventricosus]
MVAIYLVGSFGGLVVRRQARSRRVPSSKPDSTEDLSCIWSVPRYVIRRRSSILPLVWCGSLERGCQPRCRPRHLTAVQNYDIRRKIALVLLKMGR